MKIRETLDIQRALLTPFTAPSTPPPEALQRLPIHADENWLLATLRRHSLQGLWFDYLTKFPSDQETKAIISALRREKIKVAVISWQLRNNVKRIHERFELDRIPYIAFKGFQFGDRLYADPVNRIGSDLDILVPFDERERAIHALCEIGMTPRPNHRTISHECIFMQANLETDLHWRLNRPGRSRHELAPKLLEHTQSINGYYGPDDTGSMLIMLVHPLLTSRPFASDFKLIRFVDLALGLRTLQPEWESLLAILRDNGLAYLAWTMLEWCRLVTGQEAPPAVIQALSPGAARRRYLHLWMDCRAPQWVIENRLTNLAGFHLMLYERISDANKAIKGARRAAKEGKEETQSLMNNCGATRTRNVSDSSPADEDE